MTATPGRGASRRRLALGAAGGLLLLVVILWEGGAPAEVLGELRVLMEVTEPPRGSADIHRTYPLTSGVRTDFIMSFGWRGGCEEMMEHYRSVLERHGFSGQKSRLEREGARVTIWSRGQYCAHLRCIPPAFDGLNAFTISVGWRRTRIGGCH